jgi:thiamine biosynthesis lipoprotein
MRPLLGTFVAVGCQDHFGRGDASKEGLDQAIEAAFLAIEKLQSRLNRHDPASELSQLNRAGGEWFSMSSVSVRVLRLARRLMRASGGRFNCGDRACRPEDIEIQGRRVRLRNGVKISLDGIAKGFAVDLGIKSLMRSGVSAGWVNAGGDLRVFGELELPLWRREADGTFRHLSHIRNAAFATSQFGDSNFLGKIEGHFGFEPKAGVWSVLAPSAWLADALTKVACLSQDQERAGLIAKLGGHLV